MPASEILFAAHPIVRRSFPGFSTETTAVQHDNWNMPFCTLWYLVLHVHLINCYVAFITAKNFEGTTGYAGNGIRMHGATVNEGAALRLEHLRRSHRRE